MPRTPEKQFILEIGSLEPRCSMLMTEMMTDEVPFAVCFPKFLFFVAAQHSYPLHDGCLHAKWLRRRVAIHCLRLYPDGRVARPHFRQLES